MIDTTSLTWRSVAAWLDAEIADARERNDNPQPEDATAMLRGRLAALKDLRDLPERLARDEQARQDAAGRPEAPVYMNPDDYRY